MITTFFHGYRSSVAQQMIKAMIGSLNASAIAYARVQLRNKEFNRVDEDGEYRIPTIDDYNELRAAEDEEGEASDARERMGFTRAVRNEEVITTLVRLRGWYAEELKRIAGEFDKSAAPLAFAETIDFQLARAAGGNDEYLEALAAATEIDVQSLKDRNIQIFEEDKTQLRKYKQGILDMLEPIAAGFDGKLYEAEVIEDMINGLPAHVEYKLYAALVRTLDKQYKRELDSLLRSRNAKTLMEAPGTMRLLKATKDDVKLCVQQFSARKHNALSEYVERGGSLPDLIDEVVTA